MSNFVSPVKNYDYVDTLSKTNVIKKEQANDEFVKMIVEQMFLSKVMSPARIINEDVDDNEELSLYRDTKWLDDQMKSTIIAQLNETDAFGLREVMKKGIKDGN
jgi:hypothetical protein